MIVASVVLWLAVWAEAAEPACRTSTGDFTDGVGGIPWGEAAGTMSSVPEGETRTFEDVGCLIIGEATFDQLDIRVRGKSIIGVSAVASSRGTVQALRDLLSEHYGTPDRKVHALTHYEWKEGPLRIVLLAASAPDQGGNIGALTIDWDPGRAP